LLSQQGYVALFCKDGALIGDGLYGIDVHADRLRLAIEGAVPAFADVGAFEHLCAPAVIYPEALQRSGTQVRYLELGIRHYAWRKGVRYVDGRLLMNHDVNGIRSHAA